MRKIGPAILITSVLLAYGQLAAARGPGGGGGPHSGAPAVGSHAAENANGWLAADRETGLGRAAERRNAEATAQEKAAAKGKKPQKSALGKSGATDATPASPATPATPAVPGTASSPATPATPAAPATPATPATPPAPANN